MLTNRAKIRLLLVGGTEPSVLLKIMRKTKWGTGASDSVQKKLEEKTDFIAVQKKDYWSLVPITRQTLVESTKEPHTHGIQNRKPTLETGSIARWRRDLCWKHSREQNPVEFAVLVRQLKEKNMPKEYFEQIVFSFKPIHSFHFAETTNNWSLSMLTFPFFLNFNALPRLILYL